jgi:CheY-like chemotaxis protein
MAKALAGKRILIVEDDFVTGELLRLGVERAGGVPLGPVGHGRRAIELAGREAPDAAILDVSLVDGTSIEAAGYLERCGIPYAILTGYSRRSIPSQLRRAPYLEKPVTPDAVLQILHQLLPSPPPNDGIKAAAPQSQAGHSLKRKNATKPPR